MRYIGILLAALLLWAAAGCGGGGPATTPADNSVNDPSLGVFFDNTETPSLKSSSNGFVYPFEDPTPYDACWDMVFGQFMFWGTACLVYDEDADMWSMEYSLDKDLVVATGWLDDSFAYGYDADGPFFGFCDAHVDWSDAADIGWKPGQYQAKWDSNGDISLVKGDFSLELPGFDPDESPYIAIHATVCAYTYDPIWVDGVIVGYEHNYYDDETGWGGFYEWKGGEDLGYWEFGNWNQGNRWGGYNMIGSLFGHGHIPPDYPSGQDAAYKGYRWYAGSAATSYWDLEFFDITSPSGVDYDLPTLPMGNWMSDPDVFYGWCVDTYHSQQAGWYYPVRLYSTYDPAAVDPCTHGAGDPGLPILTNGNWDYINFMVNERHNPGPGSPWGWGGYSTAQMRDSQQVATWYFTNAQPPTYNGGGATNRVVSLVEAMIQYAIDNGDNYRPKHEGEWYAWVAIPWPYYDLCDHSYAQWHRAQMNIIEVDP